jgi:hypothetical protein
MFTLKGDPGLWESSVKLQLGSSELFSLTDFKPIREVPTAQISCI